MALCLLGVVAMLAHILVNRSIQTCRSCSDDALPIFTADLAFVFGAVFFDNMPRPAMMLGAAMIVASGLLITRLNRA